MLLFITMIEDDEIRSKLEIIYNLHSKSMQACAFRILKNSSDSEDAVQEAFVRLFKNAHSIKDAESPETRRFALVITENCAIDIYRKRKRLNEVELDEDYSPAANEYEYECSNRLAEAILKLPPRYRNVLFLKYVHMLDYADIAKCLDVSEVNVRKLIQRAKEKLEVLCRERGLL